MASSSSCLVVARKYMVAGEGANAGHARRVQAIRSHNRIRRWGQYWAHSFGSIAPIHNSYIPQIIIIQAKSVMCCIWKVRFSF